MIRRRRILYVEGYDPQGAEGYYGLFRRETRRFLKVWPVKLSLGEVQLDSDDFAHWNVETVGPNWQVATRYDFLRQEQVISANLAEPAWRQLFRALRWMLDDVTSGALARILRVSWRFGLVLIYFQSMLLGRIAVAAAAGWLIADAAMRMAGGPYPVWIVVGALIGVGLFLALAPLAERWFITRINNHWPYLREFARGDANCFDRAIEVGARHLVEIAGAGGADEILVIGHSGGGAIAPAVVARALELDADLGRRGPRIVLLTLGSIMPGVALHPRATRARAIIGRLAVERSIRWLDCQSRKDVLNFWNFDPVEGVGVNVGPERCNPTVWQVRFRDVVSPQFYARMRRSFFRLHYQFIMAGDRRAAYDYFMFVCGPASVIDWASGRRKMLAAFSPDAAYDDTTTSAGAT